MTGTGTVLRFDDISRRYKTGGGASSINLSIHKGEIFTLLGPSGCGKTTTLRMASGLERADSGVIEYLNRIVDDRANGVFVPPEKRGVGMVFQSYAIWPHMSVYKNVSFPLDFRKTSKREKQETVARCLDLVGLGGFETRSGMQLSGGQQQRVAVARGLVANPDLLLMDEPFSNLDASLRSQLRIELKRLQRSLGFSILFVTHDQEEALALSDRIAIMQNGEIEQVGTPRELYFSPNSAMVRDFLGRQIKFPTRIVSVNADSSVTVSFADGKLFNVRGQIKCDDLTPGARCLMTTRPESVRVEPRDDGAQKCNELDARISTLLFMGESFEADVELPGGHRTLLRVSSARGWSEDECVRLIFSEADLQLWGRED